MVTPWHLSLLLSVLIPLAQPTPCPFNPNECTCADQSSPNDFTSAKCLSKNYSCPSFSGSDGTYSIFDELEIGLVSNTIDQRAFTAFNAIKLLKLIQHEDPRPVYPRWDPKAFAGPFVMGVSTQNLAGVVPPPNALLEIADYLKTLHFINCREYVKVPANSFSKFTQLQELVIKDTPISYFDDAGLTGLENRLQRLSLIKAELRELPNALKSLKFLHLLDLSNSGIQSFKTSDFGLFGHLTTLILDGNDIQNAVNVGALYYLPDGLTTLSLQSASTPLDRVPTRVMAYNPQLEKVYLDSNRILSLKLGDFPIVPNHLAKLSLANNPIMSIDTGAFLPLTNLTWLSLAETSMTQFNMSVLNGLDKLNELDLSYNAYLTSVNISDATAVPPQLRTIYLQGSAIQEIDPTFDTILNRTTFESMNISDTTTLTCDSSIGWMAKYVLCKPYRIITQNAMCRSGAMPVAMFLSRLVPWPCAVIARR